MGGEDRTERREEIEGGSMGKKEGGRKEQGVRRLARSIGGAWHGVKRGKEQYNGRRKRRAEKEGSRKEERMKG
jgi:hypothetical protein